MIKLDPRCLLLDLSFPCIDLVFLKLYLSWPLKHRAIGISCPEGVL